MLGAGRTAARAARWSRRLSPTTRQSACIWAGVSRSAYEIRGLRSLLMRTTLGPTERYPQRYPQVVFRGVPLLIAGSIATVHLMTFHGKFSDSLVVDQLDKLSGSFLVEKLDVRRGGC